MKRNMFILSVTTFLLAANTAKPAQRETNDPIHGEVNKMLTLAEYSGNVPMVLMGLQLLAQDAKKRGNSAPHYNLCKLQVPESSLFCRHNKGITRDAMPQLIGMPAPGSYAQEKAQKTGITSEVSVEHEFKEYLQKAGYTLTAKSMPAETLKATQNELVGTKVAEMFVALLEGPTNKFFSGIMAPIFVSQDGYVLDGHHRWAAVVATQFDPNNRSKEVLMDVIQVNAPIEKLVELTNEFANKMGILQKSAVPATFLKPILPAEKVISTEAIAA